MRKDFLILLLLILPAFAPLVQRGYFTMHDDLQSMRQYQLDKCIADGQFPCRWVSDMGYGYGYPLFNYYPPLPYLVGQLFRTVGIPYIDIVKIVGIVGFVATAAFMYLFAREFWGRSGGLISSAFYTYAPYHSVDFYVRGAMNEFWAMAFYPAILWGIYRLIRDGDKKWIPITALFTAGLMLSHNPMLMIFFPVAIGWAVFWWWKYKSVKSFWPLASAALLALGLSSFFTLPVLFESKYAHLDTLVMGYFNFLAHYLNLKQIFLNINWGYGSSILGPDDTMSFALGYLHWIVPAAILLLAMFFSKLRHHLPLLLFWTCVVLWSLFMTHSKSTPIWLAIKPLEFLQFPWRFLTISVLALSVLSGSIALVLPKIAPVLLAAVIILNVGYFQPNKWFPDMTDAQKFSGKSWQLLVTSGIFDYLPIDAPFPPADPAGADMNITKGQGTFTRTRKTSNLQEYAVEISSPSAVAELQTYYYPGWKIWVDGKEQVIDPKRDSLLGRIQVDLSLGRHTILAKFTNTSIRTVANIISLVSWVFLIAIMVVWRRNPASGISTSTQSKSGL